MAAEGEVVSLDRAGAIAFVRWLAARRGEASALRALLSEGVSVARLDDEQVLALLAHRIATRAIRVWRFQGMAIGAVDGEARVDPAEFSAEVAVDETWIGIELVEDDGRPVPFDPYVIECADGTTKRGKLDAEGYAEVKGIAEGTCRVSFPERDRTDFRRSHLAFGAPAWLESESDEAAPQLFEESTWLEIELVEEDGTPVVGEPYAIQMHDRTIHTGVLNDFGRALVLGLPQGSYRVWFPERHAEDLRHAG